MSGAPLGLRERKKQQTRDALHLAAVELVEERGLGAVTTEEIAERAEVSARTFFNYFPTKEAAVVGLDEHHASASAAALAARPLDESPADSVRAVLVERARQVTGDKALWVRRVALARRHPELTHAMTAWSAGAERALADALAERLGVDAAVDLRPALLVAVTGTAIRTALINSRRKGSRPGPAMEEGLSLLDSLQDWASKTATATGDQARSRGEGR